MEFEIKDEFVDPRTVPISLVLAEEAAGNPYAALLGMFIRLGGYERELEVGQNAAFTALSAFIKNYTDTGHKAYPLLIAAHGLLEYNVSGKRFTEPKKFEILTEHVTSAITSALLGQINEQDYQPDKDSYYARILGSMLVSGGVHTKQDYTRARRFTEQMPGLSEEPPQSIDPIALFELSGVLRSIFTSVRGYSQQQISNAGRRANALLELAAALGHILAMPSVAGYYLEPPTDFFSIRGIADQKARWDEAERLYQLCINQGAAEQKLGLGKVHEARGEIEKAKALYLERSKAGDINSTLAMANLHDSLEEYVEASALYLSLAASDLAPVHLKIAEYHSGDGKSGVKKYETLALLACQKLIDVPKSMPDLAESRRVTALRDALLSRSWFSDEKAGLRRGVPAGIMSNARSLIVLPEQAEEAFPILLAEATKDGAIISVAHASELARLSAINEAVANHWHREAGLLGSTNDMLLITQRYFEGTESTPQNWITALELCRLALRDRKHRGLPPSGARGRVEKIEKAILAQKPGELPRVWIPEGDFLRPITRGDDFAAAIFLSPEWAATFLAAHIAGIHAIDEVIAVDTDTEEGDAKTAAALGNAAEPEQTVSELRIADALASAAPEADTSGNADRVPAAVPQEQLAGDNNVGVNDFEPAAPTPPEPAETAPTAGNLGEILTRHVAAAEAGSPDAALAAGTIYHGMGNNERADEMYALAIESGLNRIGLEVAERYAEISPGAERNIEFVLGLYQGLYDSRSQMQRADRRRVNALRDVILREENILEELWIVNSRKTVQRVRHGIKGDMVVIPPDAKLYLFPPDQQSIDALLAVRKTSIDAAAEAALRLAKGVGCPVDLTEAFFQLGDMLHNRQEIPPLEPDSIGVVPQDSPKRTELQETLDEIMLAMGEIHDNDDGTVEYLMPDETPIVMPKAFQKVYVEGRKRAALAKSTAG